MAISGTLRKPLGAGKKIAVVNASITGTGNLTSGLRSIDTGGAQVTVQDSSTAAVGGAAGPSIATVSSITAASGATSALVNVVVINLFTASVIAVQAQNVGLVAVGQ